MNQLDILKDMARAGFTFGKDDNQPYLRHDELFNVLNGWGGGIWNDQLYYKFHLNAPTPYISLSVEGFTDQHRVYLEDDELNTDRILTGTIHMMTWVP